MVSGLGHHPTVQARDPGSVKLKIGRPVAAYRDHRLVEESLHAEICLGAAQDHQSSLVGWRACLGQLHLLCGW
jgi:hypothetical protein